MSVGVFILLDALILVVGGAGLILYSILTRRQAISRRVDAIKPATFALAKTPVHKSGRDVPLIRLKSQGFAQQEEREIIRLMSWLGIAPERAVASFAIARVVVAVGVAAFAIVTYQYEYGGGLSLQALAVGVGASLAGWLAPAFIMTSRAKGRVRRIARGLPDALELLVVCVEAGLSLDDGIDRVVAELWESHPALADELALLSADLKILPSRDQALTNLAERIDLPTIRSIVGTLSQTMRFGTPLAHAMKVVAGEMRNDALLSMEERANRLPALMTVPMIVFILPTIMLILGGPAMLRVLDQLSQ
ncbi:MAG TPA: type II secretion system F family protein [Stellaceae bacterium]|nr:type II secretion system F family protein [Stellaceae bacterium]